MKAKNTSDSKQKIINAALYLFEEKGYSGTSINEVLEKAELTKGAFYHYFQSKEDLLLLIHEEFLNKELHNIHTIYNDKSLTNKEKLSKLVYFLFNSLDKQKESFTIFFQEYKYITEEKFKPIRNKRDNFTSYFVKVIEDGIDNGEFKKNIDPKLIVFGIVGITGWGLHWYRKDGPLTIDKIVEEYLSLIFEGILNR